MQTRSQRCLFFSSTSKNLPEICKVSMVGKSLQMSLPVFRPGACSKNFHKTNKNSQNPIYEAFECSVDNLSWRHLSDGKLIRGNIDVKGHIDFHITESGVCSKLSKICFESFSSNSIPRGRSRLGQHGSILCFTKEVTNHFVMQRSVESVRCYIKANDPDNSSIFINSNSCSFSTLTVTIFTALSELVDK